MEIIFILGYLTGGLFFMTVATCLEMIPGPRDTTWENSDWFMAALFALLWGPILMVIVFGLLVMGAIELGYFVRDRIYKKGKV